jgi:peptide chain release factor subunit 1
VGTVNEITEPTVRRLAGLRAHEGYVLSLYLNLEPSEFATPRARASEMDSLLDEAHREIEAGKRPHQQLVWLRSDLERARELLAQSDFGGGMRGFALFACAEIDLLETVSLPHAVERAVVIDRAPFVAPLTPIGHPGGWCVALVNRRVARVLRGDADGLTEVTDFGDDVHGQHDQGGWSQQRYERSIENEVDEHLKRAARVLLAEHQRQPIEGLLVASPAELRGRLVERLHPYVRERLVGYLDLDVEHAAPAQVREAAAPLIREREERAVEQELGRLRAGLARHDGHAAAGAGPVFDSLQQRRVEVLFYRRGLTIAGAVCPQCGLIASGPGECRVDGTPLEPRENAVEAAIEEALGQSARVRELDGPDLDPLGGIAALLRF